MSNSPRLFRDGAAGRAPEAKFISAENNTFEPLPISKYQPYNILSRGRGVLGERKAQSLFPGSYFWEFVFVELLARGIKVFAQGRPE